MQNEIDLQTEETLMTEGEILQSAEEEWLGILAKLWTSVGKTPTPEQLQVYKEMLGDVPMGLLERAVDRILLEHKFNSVPTIGNVWDAFLKELNPPPGMSVRESLERWEERLWKSVVYQFDEV